MTVQARLDGLDPQVAPAPPPPEPYLGKGELTEFSLGTLYFKDFKGGVTEGRGFHTAVRGTMFVRNGAVTRTDTRARHHFLC